MVSRCPIRCWKNDALSLIARNCAGLGTPRTFQKLRPVGMELSDLAAHLGSVATTSAGASRHTDQFNKVRGSPPPMITPARPYSGGPAIGRGAVWPGQLGERSAVIRRAGHGGPRYCRAAREAGPAILTTKIPGALSQPRERPFGTSRTTRNHRTPISSADPAVARSMGCHQAEVATRRSSDGL